MNSFRAIDEDESTHVTLEDGSTHVIKSIDGSVRYYNERGYTHREDGPAYESSKGYIEWWIDGRCHREDGPARMWINKINNSGDEYYLDGRWYSKEDWEAEVKKRLDHRGFPASFMKKYESN